MLPLVLICERFRARFVVAGFGPAHNRTRETFAWLPLIRYGLRPD